jgi:hypothetical protein
VHIPTHILSGWCLANYLPLSPRERLFAMVAATIADIDGVTLIAGQDMYWRTHHVLAHNLPFALIVATVLTVFSSHRLLAFLLYLALFHLHLLMDYWGSGPLWPIYYLYPFSDFKWVNPDSWNLFSWQNTAIAGLMLAWTVLIARRQGRTPLELIAPRLDRLLVVRGYKGES